MSMTTANPSNSSAHRQVPARRSGSFPLTSLALLVTVCAISLACADLNRWREQTAWLTADSPWPLVVLFGAGGFFGALIGLVHPLIHGFTWRSAAVAPASGFLAGLMGVFILAAPGPLWQSLFAVAILLAATIILRVGAE